MCSVLILCSAFSDSARACECMTRRKQCFCDALQVFTAWRGHSHKEKTARVEREALTQQIEAGEERIGHLLRQNRRMLEVEKQLEV